MMADPDIEKIARETAERLCRSAFSVVYGERVKELARIILQALEQVRAASTEPIKLQRDNMQSACELWQNRAEKAEAELEQLRASQGKQ